jgi:hypothetical protein
MGGTLVTTASSRRALRRHHDLRLKRRRRTYLVVGGQEHNPRIVGMTTATPCRCSYPICGKNAWRRMGHVSFHEAQVRERDRRDEDLRDLRIDPW